MPRRIITSDLYHDKRVLKLPDSAKSVWVGIIAQTDDEGIFDPDPDVIRACMALNASPEQVAADVQRILDLKLAVAYQVNGAPLAFLPAFYKHQKLNRPTPSKHIRPPDDLLLDYPDYLDGRFTNFNQPQSRHRDLFKQPRVTDSSVTRQSHDSDATMTRQCPDSVQQHEGKGKERKGKEVGHDSDSTVTRQSKSNTDTPPTPQGGLSASGRESQTPSPTKPYVSPNVFEPVLTRGKPAESFNRHGLGLPPLSPTRKPLDFNNPANFPSQAELDQILGPRTSPSPTEPSLPTKPEPTSEPPQEATPESQTEPQPPNGTPSTPHT